MFQVFFNGVLGLTCIVMPVQDNSATCVDHQDGTTFFVTPESFHQSSEGLAAMGVTVEAVAYIPDQDSTLQLQGEPRR